MYLSFCRKISFQIFHLNKSIWIIISNTIAQNISSIIHKDPKFSYKTCNTYSKNKSIKLTNQWLECLFEDLNRC